LNPKVDILCDENLFNLLEYNCETIKIAIYDQKTALKRLLDKKNPYTVVYGKSRNIVLTYENFCNMIMQICGRNGIEMRKMFMTCKKILCAYLHYEQLCEFSISNTN
jgi:hypothetical protein